MRNHFVVGILAILQLLVLGSGCGEFAADSVIVEVCGTVTSGGAPATGFALFRIAGRGKRSGITFDSHSPESDPSGASDFPVPPAPVELDATGRGCTSRFYLAYKDGHAEDAAMILDTLTVRLDGTAASAGDVVSSTYDTRPSLENGRNSDFNVLHIEAAFNLDAPSQAPGAVEPGLL